MLLTDALPTTRHYAKRPPPVVGRPSWVRLAVIPAAIGLALAPSTWWPVVTSGLSVGPLTALVSVPVLAAGVGWYRLRVVPRGPRIHDRQLDMIVCGAASVVAAVLLLMAPQHPGGPFTAVAECLLAAAIIAAGWGSRALWQVRWAVLVLVLSWREPWAAVVAAVAPDVTARALALAPVLDPAGVVAVYSGVAWICVAPDGKCVMVDSAAEGGLLVLLLAGVLCGVAAALCVTGAARRVGAVVLGTVLGGAASLLRWAAVLWSAGGGAAVTGWGEHAMVFQLAAVLVAAVLSAVGVQAARDVRRRRAQRHTEGGTADAARRIQVAVPRARPGTAVVVALGIGFALLAAGVMTPAGTAGGAAASSGTGVAG